MIKAFTIERSQWLSGDDLRGKRVHRVISTMLNPEVRKMCCLGFYSKACGLTDDQINSQPVPASIFTLLPEQMGWLTQSNAWGAEPSTLGYELTGANDNTLLSRKEREEEIRSIFAKVGIAVGFTGEYRQLEGAGDIIEDDRE